VVDPEAMVAGGEVRAGGPACRAVPWPVADLGDFCAAFAVKARAVTRPRFVVSLRVRMRAARLGVARTERRRMTPGLWSSAQRSWGRLFSVR